MKIRIFQIDVDRDIKKDRIAFCSMDQIERITYKREVDATLYDKVFDGDVEAGGLQDLFYIFNVKHPTEYRGHSLSVSDIVQILDDERAGYYFCDSFGWLRVYFDAKTKTLSEHSRMHLYNVSADGGKTWTCQWLLANEIDDHQNCGHIVEPYSSGWCIATMDDM